MTTSEKSLLDLAETFNGIIRDLRKKNCTYTAVIAKQDALIKQQGELIKTLKQANNNRRRGDQHRD